MCGLIAKAVYADLEDTIASRLGEAPDWNAFVDSDKAFKFYMPLDPFLEAHNWGMFGTDCGAALNPGAHVAQGAHQPTTHFSHIEQDVPSFPIVSDVPSILIVSATPPPPTLTEEQVQLIATNRRSALERRNNKRLEEVRKHPVSHVQSEIRDESQTVMLPCVPHFGTCSHRNKFAFGKITAKMARHHLACNGRGVQSHSSSS